MRSWLTAIHACMRDGGPPGTNGESGKIGLIRKYDVFRIQLGSWSEWQTWAICDGIWKKRHNGEPKKYAISDLSAKGFCVIVAPPPSPGSQTLVWTVYRSALCGVVGVGGGEIMEMRQPAPWPTGSQAKFGSSRNDGFRIQLGSGSAR